MSEDQGRRYIVIPHFNHTTGYASPLRKLLDT